MDPGSPADQGGLRAGDKVLSVEGHAVRDVLDWQWLAGEGGVEVDVERDGTPLLLEMPLAEAGPVGVAFASVVFDGVRTCRNDCLFCFMAQLPEGLRRSLYLRDDDFRLSFLHGNFVTLTNLSDDDVGRVLEQRLSPLYFSLQAVTPEVRGRVVCARDDMALDRADTLLDGGIDLHVQVVLVPGVNDGEELERTLDWCARREGVLSVGLVPVGYTSHSGRITASYEDPTDAAAVIGIVERWQERMLDARGSRLVWAADEFYLNARRELPEYDDYEEFDQFENGIGMSRAFVDEVREAAGVLPRGAARGPLATLVTGELFAPVLGSLAPDLASAGLPVRVLPVANTWFGGDVTVAGLLGGRDLVRALEADGWDGPYLLPDVIANEDGLLLDDVRASDLPVLTGKPAVLVPYDAQGLVSALQGLVKRAR